MTMLRPGADLAEVPMTQAMVVCPTHAEPLRGEWPKGWDVFATIVSTRALASPALQTGLADPRFWREPGLLWGDLPDVVTVSRMQQLLRERPACEWLRFEELLAAYLRSGIGVAALCRLCGILRAGTPYGVRWGHGREIVGQICFVCVASGRVRE